MKNRTFTLAMSVASLGFAAMGSAQQITVAGPVTFGGPIGSVLNTYLTGESPVTTAFIMGSGVTVQSAEITEVHTNTYATEATVRMENSAFPTIFYATDFTSTGAFVGTFSAVAGTVRPWTTNGNNGATIPVASTWNLEFYETFDDGGVGADATGTNIDFTINQPPAPPTHTDLGTVTDANPLMVTINSLDPNGVYWYKFNLATAVNSASDQWLSIWTSGTGLDSEIGLYRPDGTVVNTDDDSGAVDFSAFVYGLMPGDPNSGYDQATADATTLAAGDYYLAVGLFDTVFAADFSATSTGTGGGPVTLNITRGTVQYPLDVTLAGPYAAGGPPGSADNSVFTIASVGTAFIYPKTMILSAQGTEVIGATNLNEVRLRVRSSAFPGISTDYFMTSSTATTVNIASVLVTSPDETSAGWNEAGSNSLKGLTIPAGSTLTGELFDYFDNGAGSDSDWSNLTIKLPEGAAIPTASAPTAVDLGVVTDATLTTPITALTGPNTAAQVFWYKITLPGDVSLSGGKFLNVWTSLPPITTGALTDSVISIYDANGKYISNNDQGANLAQAAFSFGASGYTAPWTPASADPDFNGHSGEGLKAGDYYIAVSGWSSGVTGRGDGFVNAGGGSATAQGTQLNIVSNLTAGVTGTLNLGDTIGSFAYPRNISYEVKQGVTTLASGTLTVNAASSSLSIPVSGSGAAQLILDGSSFLKRIVNFNLSSPAVGTVLMQNGDVNNTGEVDAADIDQVIADFGSTSDIASDTDVNGEVDAADIDIVIANFGGVDDI
ncbi:MAG: hypothetical protein JNK63_08680 [Chthonomonas sp.]|nr:hypothetical protein [Chthonomonas sp.]